MGIVSRIIRRKPRRTNTSNEIKECSYEDVMNAKTNSCTYSYLLCDNLKLPGEISCMISTKFVEGDTLGTFDDYNKYVSTIGISQTIQIYNDNCKKVIFDFGRLKLIDVVMELPDNDVLIIKLVWERLTE